MKKINRIYKVLIIIITLVLSMLICYNVNAAGLSASVNGNTVTISSPYTGSVNITVNGGTASENNAWLENGTTAQVTINNTSDDGATITITPTVKDAQGRPILSDANGELIPVDSVSVNIPGVQKPAPQPEKPAEPQESAPEPPKPVEQPKQVDPTFTNANKKMYATGNINLRSSWSTSSAATPIQQGTEVTVTGTSTQNVNGYVWYRVSYNGQTKYVASGLLTATKPAESEEKDDDKKDDEKNTEKSTNKALKDLVIENYKLTPEFDPDTTKYTLTVGGDVDKLEISPILADEKSKFEITGNENFNIGNNIVRITVTAEDGTARIYSITVTKNKDEEEKDKDETLKLKKLEIKNAKLEPSFSADKTVYSITVNDPSSIKTSDVIAEAENEDAKVSIAESETDRDGEKVITIMVENADGTESTVYQITVKKAASNPIEIITKNKNNKIYYILGTIIGILLVLIIIIIILLKKNSDKNDPIDIKEEDELSDDYDYSLKNAIDEANSKIEDEQTQEFDEMIENSNEYDPEMLNAEDYNVFEDKGDGVGVDDSTKKFNTDDEELEIKPKKKGKHF